ncbi:hypothetical protein GCM10023084_78390 [Streptomyces lacrimifluminis]|uniref:Uncharacterized protein n=1 Tax=Streptomyces lacrimifluminis TaxID=1500077 RepID=A0A917PAP1_9ACTN|nr:hypothetical protein [Streptomyces lacrimifluminis]GGJ68572.1 hypothetical protein GCM10012282_76910 [Streptomyces lacrimifluminis]
MSAQPPVASTTDARRTTGRPTLDHSRASATGSGLVPPRPLRRITDRTRARAEVATDDDSPASIKEPAR